jgi:hypothetical protein
MRTKTMLLSALLGGLGSVSVMAQTNVYSLNAVGYINITVTPGFNIITCPLITSPDNTIGTILTNGNGTAGTYVGPYTGDFVYFYNNSSGQYSVDNAVQVGGRGGTANTNGWAAGGTNVLSPGVACWLESAATTNIIVTLVGTVPTGPITNVLAKGFSLVGSAVPMSGDLCSNSISSLTNYNVGDSVYTFYAPAPAASQYTIFSSGSGRGQGGNGYHTNWNVSGDPFVTNVGTGFFYDNLVGTTVNWVENYSVAQ